MNPKLKEKVSESLSAVLPITAIVLIVSLFVDFEISMVMMFLVGALMLIFGMGFFQLGAEMSMTPLGEGIGAQLSKSKSAWVMSFVAFVMGVIITISEPDLQVLAEQVSAIPNMVLILTVAVGVGVFLAMAVLRILFKINLSTLLMVLYSLLIVFSFFIPKEFIAIAFDSGGVTTGPMTVPFIMALGVGLASARSDKDSSDDSFGLVAMSSVGPILTVLILGLLYNPDEVHETITESFKLESTTEIAKTFAHNLPKYAEEVFVSLAPILAVFLIFQVFWRRFSRRDVNRIAVGLVYTYVGLVLFLCGVNVGFAPLGNLFGGEMASLYKWGLVPIGALIGYFIVKAEPAIQVLNHQVDSVTNGAISAHAMNRCMSIGVSVSVALAMLRILLHIPILYILIPGYIVALVLSRFVLKIFVGIAFDSGGVASGPMTSTFLLPLSAGACKALGGNIMTEAFGVVSLVALTPLIAIQIMGVVYQLKTRRLERAAVAETIPADSDDIVMFEEA
ncbi:MAG: DUF1538 domain-containing protein [Clostridia bacterium]|nr:DUF1538 domain-containing protein [Clostridia bacterium]